MAWIYAYEMDVIEQALRRLREDGVLREDDSYTFDVPERLGRAVVSKLPELHPPRSLIAEVGPLRAILAWLRRVRAIRSGPRWRA